MTAMTGPRMATFIALLLAWGCDTSERPPPPPPGDAAIPSQFVGARRPSRSYFMANTSGRCIVYWVDGQQHSVSRSQPCPRELEPGERARLAGRVCIRESDDHSREGPMRCPQPLVNAAHDDRQDAGEDRLPPASTTRPKLGR
jgi:hypothetical protein